MGRGDISANAAIVRIEVRSVSPRAERAFATLIVDKQRIVCLHEREIVQFASASSML